ncbi:MAG: SusC/RagA family TonB-linked outer membrane protein [Parabacteroides sp.]|nr:SusC/RagA family TonB-linked outer membrane protein [Parabacteroides sp.]
MTNYRKNPSDVVHKSSKKKSLILFCAACILLINPICLFAQAGEVTLSVENATLKQLFDVIEKQSHYKFSYRDYAVAGKDPVTLNVTGESLKKVLTDVLRPRKLKYEVNATNIVVVPADGEQKVKTVIGKVTDSAGEPVVGANVVEKGTTNGTITDMNGNYSLEVSGNTLTVSYIGYAPQDITVGNKARIDVRMMEDMQRIDEVVVVGYGTQKKVNLTGSVETIKADVIENRPLRSATDALQGTIPGLTVTSTAGQPGNFSDFTIRGKSSVNSGSALILIDGMPGDINTVNPLDIESVSVLKDAASSAIYGARAAEGVILVTTKQGNSSKVKVDYSGNISFNTPTRIPESNNAWDHALLSNIAFNNAGLAVQFPQDALDAIRNHTTTAIPKGNDWIYTADVDWIGMMMDHGFQENHNLTVSKSDDRLKYLFSFGWLDQDGLFAEYGPDNYDRFNLRSNVNLDIIKDKLNFDSRITFNNTNQRYHPSFDYSYAGEEDAYNPLTSGWTIPYIVFVQAGPNMPVYDPNGNYARYRMQANPIQALREGGTGQNKGNNIEGIFTLSFKPVKGLTLKAVGGIRYKNQQIKDWRAEYGKYGPDGLISMNAGQTGPNRIIQKTRNTRYMTGQLIGEYKATIRKNEMSVLGGWSTEQNRYDQLRTERINIVGNSLPALSLGATEGWSNSAIEEEWALLSGFMRVNYAYDSRYLAEFNFRADASSRFSKKHQWGFFPSASVGWRITEEAFMKDQDVFTNLKIRASWGRLGNQNGLGLYDHIPQYTVGGYYPFQNELAQWAVMNKLPSETRTWETVEMENIAVDMSERSAIFSERGVSP